MTGPERFRRGRRSLAKLLVFAAAASLSTGCGAKTLSVGSVPFPAEKPIFADERGTEIADLPRTPESVRLVFLDFPWCPQCDEAWDALGAAAEHFPRGSVRVFRVLFDRERLYALEGGGEVAPLRPVPVPGTTGGHPGIALLEVTSLTALTRPFKKQFRVGHAPVLLLLDGSGQVVKRWTGYSPSLRDSLVEQVNLAAGTSQPREK